MTTTPRPTASRTETAALLAYGLDLARDHKGADANVEDAVWYALADALDVLAASPDREARWLRSGKWTSFRDIGFTRAEADATVRQQYLAGIRPEASRRPNRERDLDRAMLVMDWWMHVRAAREGDRLTKAAIVMLRADDKVSASNVMWPGKRYDRRLPWQIRKRAIRAIVLGIERQFGVEASALLAVPA